jgi:5-oxoprolinase (ATP-hydrolysing) subunit A
MHTIDLNADIGEGMDSDAAMVPYLTSASIACGGHYGDAASMETAIRVCQRHGVAVGAHPSYPDKVGFGRKTISLHPAVLMNALMVQLNLFEAITGQLGAAVHHIKPHGALYNDIAADEGLAQVFASMVAHCFPGVPVYMLSGSKGSQVLQQRGIAVLQEVFADRTYTPQGLLTPRSQPNALHHSEQAVVEQVLGLVQRQQVCSIDGQWLPLRADTVCLHSDTPGAAAMARSVHSALLQAGITLQSFV